MFGLKPKVFWLGQLFTLIETINFQLWGILFLVAFAQVTGLKFDVGAFVGNGYFIASGIVTFVILDIEHILALIAGIVQGEK